MTGREKCRQLGDELVELKGLRDDFARELELWKAKKDLSGQELVDLKGVINALQKGDTELAKLWVPPEFEHLKLKGQYDSQVKVAWKSGLFGDRLNRPVKSGMQLHLQPEGMHAGLPVIERNGQKYPMPSWRDVAKILRKPENREIIKEKSAQGFTQMLIVPFGYDLQTMAQKFKAKVRELDEEGLNADGSSNPDKGIFGVGGEKVEFKREDADYPFWAWEWWNEEQMVYYPKQYDPQNHGGKTKEDAIKINGVWQVCFVEDVEKMAVIPLQSDGQKDVIGGRKRIDRKGSCIKGQTGAPSIKEFKEAMANQEGESGKKQMQDPTKYRHEKGQTPEQYLWMQLTSLLSKDKPVLMDYENSQWMGTYLIDCYNVASDDVPFALWEMRGRLMQLGRCSIGSRDDHNGVRFSVDITK